MTAGLPSRDSFSCLIDLLHQNTKGRRWMACLQLYLDESGSASTHPVVVVAGFMGLAEAWTGFADKWSGILAEYGVRAPFHMTDFEAKKEQFAEPEWDDESKRRALFGALMREITSRPLCAIGAAVAVDWFRDLDWNLYPDHEPLEDPYHMVMQDVLRKAVEASSDPDLTECHGDKIATVIAKQRQFEGAAKSYYAATSAISGEGKLVKAATFAEMDDFPQLQAADIMAFELRWKLTRPDLNRYPWREIINTGRVVMSVRGIDPTLVIPSERGQDYAVTLSMRARPIDLTLRAKDSKRKRNQGKRSRKDK